MLPVALAAGLALAAPRARSQAVSPVIELLHNARDARTRAQAAITLGRLRPAGSRQALESALDDPAAAVRAAAVQSLVALGDGAALGALRAHASDRDPGVRAGITRAVESLSSSASNAGAIGGGNGADWSHARFVLRLGTIANRANGAPSMVEVMRNAIVEEVTRSSGGMAMITSALLPPEAEQRIRSGRAREYALEGAVNTLRQWTVATTLSVRAEVSLVLMTHPSHAIVGSLSGAATAQDHTPYYDAARFERQLQERALVAAVHGALGNLQQSLLATR
jgi:hypothetical protein